MKILHIHQDYPDGTTYASTKAVSNLLDEVEVVNPSIEHFVLSIHRTSNPFKVSIQRFERGISLVYWAIPLPFIYRLSIAFWSWFISKSLEDGNFSLIHAHKLTTEGMFGIFLSEKLKIKYLISIRGGSDIHNIKRLKDCKSLFKKIYAGAERVFWVSLWARNDIENRLGVDSTDLTALPNICHIESMEPKPNSIKERYCIILNFDQYERKGIVPLLHAFRNLTQKGKKLKLDIIGGGNHINKSHVISLISELKLESQVKVTGQVDRVGIISALQHSKGLLLPSINETFGMAFVEAAACGCPFIYVKETGIDGYFEHVSGTVKIENQSVESIEKGILALENYECTETKVFDDDFTLNGLKCFHKKYIVDTYLNVINHLDIRKTRK